MPTTTPRRQDSDATLQDDAQALYAALSQLMRVYQVRDRDKICCYDVSVTQCHALEVLVLRGSLRSVGLAEELRLDKSTTSRVIDALVRKGYVEKLADPDDARAALLRVSRSGRALYQRIHREMIAQQAELIRGLDADVRAGATDILRRLAQAAEDRFAPGLGQGGCAPAAPSPGKESSR
jgi:DNA-binding MarR family transcriptional regulator